MVGVLDVAPDGAGVEQGVDQVVRGQVVAALEVGRHRHVDCGGDLPQLGEGGLPVAVAVRSAACGRHGHARGGDGRASGRDHRPGAGGVPHVGG